MNVLLGTDAICYPLTGIGRYAYELAKRLPQAADIESIHYLHGSKVSKLVPERPVEGPTQLVNQRLKRFARNLPRVVTAYYQVKTMLQKQALGKFEDHIFHGPNYYLPSHRGPCVATFHDLSVFLWPECHPKARVQIMQKALPEMIKRAQVLLTDSEFTRLEIATYFNWPLDRIIAAPLAASPEFRPINAVEAAPVLAQFGLNFGAYSLFVGTLDPRKNIDLLLDAYEHLPQPLRRHRPLVVAGFEGWNSERTIARLRAGERAGWARYLNFVDEASLPALYAGARVFLYPSRYEGFGLPVLEAMAAGIPVICSNAASLPEVTNDAATLIAIEDIDALYVALLRALEDDVWCKEASQRGLKRASTFSWDKTISKTLTAYQLASQ